MNLFSSFDPLAKRKVFIVLTILLVVLTFFLRFYRLSEVPPALYQDETAIGYNAYLILTTGRDEHNVPYPVYFTSFGDHKLPTYIYATALSIKTFGLTSFAVRFPSALFGSLSVILLFILVLQLTKNKTLSLLSSTLLAINPWHLHFSRAAFEVNVGLSFVLLGIVLFIFGLDRKKVLFLFLSLISFGISLYAYNATRLLAPLFLVGLVYLNYKNLLRLQRQYLVGLVIVLVILLLPFVITFLSPSGVYSAKNALITSSDIHAKNLEFRSYLVDLPQPIVSLFYNKYIFQAWQYMQNVASFLSASFFYISGTNHGNQGIGNYGVFHFFELPFFIAGLILFFIKKNTPLRLFALWLVACVITVALSKEVPHATRGYFFVIPGVVFAAVGIFYFSHFLTVQKNIMRLLFIVPFVFLTIYSIQFYFLSYYFRFPSTYARAWRTADRDIAFYLKDRASSYDKIIIDSRADLKYTSILFYTAYLPHEFLQTVKRHPTDSEGFIEMKSFGKYEFREIDWARDYPSKKTLFITNFERKPDNIPLKKTFYLPTRHIVTTDKEKILQYPEHAARYVIVE
jgi:predicted membrane-bound mannosyltransferase